jgi:phosphoenolpyruvate carboxykinase (ATP)
VPDNILNPRNTWNDGEEYDKAAENLAKQFITNFEKYASGVAEEVIAAGPKI